MAYSSQHEGMFLIIKGWIFDQSHSWRSTISNSCKYVMVE